MRAIHLDFWGDSRNTLSDQAGFPRVFRGLLFSRPPETLSLNAGMEKSIRLHLLVIETKSKTPNPEPTSCAARRRQQCEVPKNPRPRNKLRDHGLYVCLHTCTHVCLPACMHVSIHNFIYNFIICIYTISRVLDHRLKGGFGHFPPGHRTGEAEEL